jgi:broad specificity phosphatase PhoE
MIELLRILLVRHGESEGNAGLPTEDPASARLTAAGEAQARAVASMLGPAPGLFVVSPYERARLTSLPSLARHPEVPVEVWPVQEFTYLAPRSYQGTTVSERRPDADAYWEAADPRAVLGPGAESYAEFHARAESARRRFEALGPGLVVVFSHKKFINALLWAWLAGPREASASAMRRFRGFDRAMAFPNGAFVEVELSEGGPRVGAVRMAHLEGALS